MNGLSLNTRRFPPDSTEHQQHIKPAQINARLVSPAKTRFPGTFMTTNHNCLDELRTAPTDNLFHLSCEGLHLPVVQGHVSGFGLRNKS